MQIIKQTFTDFDVYNASVKDWQLDYNILSHKDFNAKLNMFTDETFAISRITLQGKLVHRGLTPIGFRSFVIPINYKEKFIWFNKGSGGNELLVFPKNCKIDAVTFNDFDAIVVSIENNLLEEKLQEIDCYKCDVVFGEKEQELFLSKEFAKEFNALTKYFLTKHIKNTNFSDTASNKHTELVNQIIYKLLEYIQLTRFKKPIKIKSVKDNALKEAIDFIHNNSESIFSVKELSLLTNVSERTLLSAFKERYNVSPSEYIKSYRLNKVKNELFALKDSNINISAIAGKYHFWHMGQFAKDFKKHFGVLPSEV